MTVLAETREKYHFIIQAICGSALIAIGSMIMIPIKPVPITMQTLAILFLAMTQRPLVCLSSILLYLFEGTVGLPVFAGKCNPFWFLGTTSGYLIGFPVAGFVISSLLQKLEKPLLRFSTLFFGQFIIHFFGFLGLVYFLGVEKAFKAGVLFFVPIDLLKAGLAIYLSKFFKDFKLKFFP